MKKIILSLVFVFTMGTMVNANSKNATAFSLDCHEYADITQGISLLAGFSYGDSLSIWANAYSACVGYNMSSLVEIEEDELIDWSE